MEGDTSEILLKKEEADEDIKLTSKVWNESKKTWIVAGPAIFTRASTFGVNVISLAFMEHIGPTELAAYAIISTILLRFANGILLGMASALETLCGQAYGAKQNDMMGVYLQRSWLVLLACTVGLLPVFLFATPILIALGQDEAIAEVSGTVALWFIPVLFSFIISMSCQMFLQAQSKNMIIAYLAAFTLAIHVFLSWLLTVKYKFGLAGAMISTNVAFWIPNIGQLLFVLCGGCPETCREFSFLAFKDLWPVIKLSMSSGVMLCLNINCWEMMIAFGFLAAASVRVSNELGRGSSSAAKFSILVTVLTSFAIGFVLFIFFLLFRGRLAYIFTESPQVAAAVADLSPLLACSILLNSVQPVLSGVAVGSGRQSIIAFVNIGCYYMVGIPIGAVFGYVLNYQVKGVWLGMLLGTFAQTIILTVITYKTDWNKQVMIAQQRLKRWEVRVVQDEADLQGS